jgi:RNA polymerase sigma-70 factor, ECF subfamily
VKLASGEPIGADRAHLSVVDEVPPGDDQGPSTEANDGPQGVDPASSTGVDEGFVALYEEHYPRLVRALELSGADRETAEDVAQEAFSRTLARWPRVRRGTNPAGYVYRVAFRHMRRRRYREYLVIDESTTPDIATEVTVSLAVERALQAMPPAQRRCAVLCLVAGVSTKDAARSLRIAESTVRKQIERSRRDLRHVLGDHL